MASSLPPAAESPPSSPSPPPARSRSGARVAAIVIALILVVALVAAYVVYVFAPEIRTGNPKLNIPAHVTSYLSNGTTLLDVPLMTEYTAPALQNHGFATNMSLTMSSAYGGPSTTFTFLWGNVSGTNETVRFVLSPTVGESLAEAFEPGPPNGFLALPAGNCSQPGSSQSWGVGDENVGESAVFHELWRMEYNVSRMAATVDDVAQSWIQVNYSLEFVLAYAGDPLPAANVSLPSPSDLSSPVFVATYNLSKGQTIGTLVEARPLAAPLGPFRHLLQPMTIDAGAAGNLSVGLTSQFQWGPTDDIWLGWSLTAARDGPLTASYSVDLRFGSILVAFS